MTPLRVGAGLAAVLAGPPLYALVQTGQLNSTGALVRGLIVALVCTAGASYIFKLANGYSEDMKRREMIEKLTEAIEAAHEVQAEKKANASGFPTQPGSPTDTPAQFPTP